MITVGPMQLHHPRPPDGVDPFFVGGDTTDMSRISSHDHSGGLLGAPVAVTIPDGSITAADLDPSVLAPYALTDGSKPFTGQVTMQADPWCGTPSSSGSRGRPGAGRHPLPHGAGGAAGGHPPGGGGQPGGVARQPAGGAGRGRRRPHGLAGGSGTELLNNSLFGTDATYRAVVGAQAASRFEMSGGMAFGVSTAPAVAAGAARPHRAPAARPHRHPHPDPGRGAGGAGGQREHREHQRLADALRGLEHRPVPGRGVRPPPHGRQPAAGAPEHPLEHRLHRRGSDQYELPRVQGGHHPARPGRGRWRR